METSLWTLAVAANRWALYAFVLVAAGSALFLLLMRLPEPVAAAARRLGTVSAIIGIICYGLAVALGGAEMITGGVDILFAPDTWAMGFDSTLGQSALAGGVAMILLVAGFRRGHPRALGIGAALAVGSFLMTGHAATAAPVWLMSTMVAAHLACAAFWIGALYPLSRAIRLPAADAGGLMTQFSRLAVWSVALLAASGAVISWVQLGHVSAIFTTPYGGRLAVKLALFAVLIALAAYNKLALTPRLTAGAPAPRLRGIIGFEYVLYIFILGAAASLSVTEPPRALAHSAAP
ncbi:MAG: copper resistance D family protein [Rhodospirillaceae bacterium]